MTREQKQEVMDLLKTKFSQYSNFYITDTESLSVSQMTTLRHACFDKEVEMKVAKNTLIRKALESLEDEKYSGIYEVLNNVTALMFSESPKDPAVIISGFRKAENPERPILKAAFINGDIYIGDDKLAALTKIKTRDELIGDVITLLLSPIQRVLGALENKEEATGKAETATDAKEEAAPEATEAPAAEAKAEEAPAEAPKAEEKAAEEAPKDETPNEGETKSE